MAPVLPQFVDLKAEDLTQQEAYKLLIGSVVPRPIAFVSTQSPTGQYNLAPFSFYNGVCSNPPTVLFCPTIRGSDGAKKDTLLNIEATGEFVVNVVTEDIVAAMNQTSAEYPTDVDEFKAAHLTPTPSLLVRPPRVAESPVHMECQLNQIVQIGDGSLGSGFIVIGTVVYFHVREDLYEKGRILTEGLKPVARLAGSAYCPVRDVFEIPRPSL